LHRIKYIAFIVGCAIAVALIIFFRKVPLTFEENTALSKITFPIFPTSLMLMDADTSVGLTMDAIVLYTIVTALNGLWYVAVVAVLGKVWRSAQKTG
jgi:hypothetical protein